MAGRRTLIRAVVIVAVFAGFVAYVRWSIPNSPRRSCLVAYEVTNAWTQLGTHRVMFSDGRVGFVGMGPDEHRPRYRLRRYSA